MKFFKKLLSTVKFDFKPDDARSRADCGVRDFHRILLGHEKPRFRITFKKSSPLRELPLRVSMMIRVGPGSRDSAEVLLLHLIEKNLGPRDSGDHTHDGIGGQRGPNGLKASLGDGNIIGKMRAHPLATLLGRPIRFGQNDPIGSFESRRALAGPPERNHLKRLLIRDVDQDDVKIAFQTAMLKTVIDDKNLKRRILSQGPNGRFAFRGADENPELRKSFRQQKRFVTDDSNFIRMRRIHPTHSTAVGFVVSRDDSDFLPCSDQLSRQSGRDGRFPRASDGQIPDADDGNRQLFRRKKTPVETSVSKSHDRTVKAAGRTLEQ